MSYRELFVSPSPVFTGNQQSFEEAEYVILGVPFDVTSTYRSGAKFAPLAIRDASLNIEGYSFRSNVDIKDLKIHDLGDLHVAGDVELTLGRLALVTQDLLDAEKVPVFLGGENSHQQRPVHGPDSHHPPRPRSPNPEPFPILLLAEPLHLKKPGNLAQHVLGELLGRESR